VQNTRSILRVHFHLQHGAGSQEQYEGLLDLLQNFTPRVQPLPQDYSAELDRPGPAAAHAPGPARDTRPEQHQEPLP
jgi:hypothetical protein